MKSRSNASMAGTCGLDGRPAAIAPAGFGGNILLFGFSLGRTHAEMLHEGPRNLVGKFMAEKV